jgi:hypothetical protein
VPESNEITEVLKKMHAIAAREAFDPHGRSVDPVLEYDSGDRVVHVVDPFFAFRLRWGVSVLAAA